ncbi:MAG: phosphoadenylyl-sulfate reductase [bacterium]
MRQEETASVNDSNISALVEIFEDFTASEVLEWALQKFGSKIALITSFQSEGMVILDMAVKINPEVRVLTIDTGRLHEETYGFMDQVRLHYGVEIGVHFPDSQEVHELVSRHGINLFYKNVDSRLACCQVRKVHPLKQILSGLDAWITGLRRQQSTFRLHTQKIEVDHNNRNLVKVNPLADWTDVEVSEYIEKYEVPKHPLYGQGYTSIGCAPCTRPVENGEHNRAGRWWWEEGVNKECGLHCRTSTS